MLGAIIGDTVGSRFEWHNHKSKEFEFLTYQCQLTDDSIMTLAVADAILKSCDDRSDLSELTIHSMQQMGRLYPNAGYGLSFQSWIQSPSAKPYESFGNGAAMRISPVGFAARSMEETKSMSEAVTRVTHNHPEGIKGAEATAVAIFMALHGANILEIRDYIDRYYYPMDFTLDGIRSTYTFNETCQDTVPQAFMAFFESTGFEDAIRNAISIGGDSDTVAAITGGLAEAYYGIPSEIRKHELTFLDERQLAILIQFENKYHPCMEKKIENEGSVPIRRSSEIYVGGNTREQMMDEAIKAADQDLENSEVHAEETSSQKLFNFLYEDCNILRGPINQDEYKSYVTPILFFKRLSDVYDEEHKKALVESGGDEEYANFEENYSFYIPDGCHWNDVRNVSQNVGQAIVKAMSGIERANPEYLSGVFSSFDDATWTDKNKLSDERLKNLIEHMSQLKVGNNNYSADVMGDAYEYLIKKFADLSKKNAGEFYTPRTVVKLMVMLLNPQAGETVYDPTCGSAGMLISAVSYLQQQGLEWRNVSLYGQEINSLTSSIARMNLFLHGIQDFHIVNDDTLARPAFVENGQLKTFDICLANPPYSIKQWNRDAFEKDPYGRNFLGTPPQGRADYAFFQHILKSLDKETGRCAILFPHGVLFRNEEKDMREKLVRGDYVECVIGLAANLFYNSPMEACIVICRMSKPQEHVGKVLFINAIDEVTRKNAQSYLEDSHIAKIADAYTNYREVENFSKIVTVREISENDFSLSIPLYVKAKSGSEEEDTRTFESVYEDWDGTTRRAFRYYQQLNEMIQKGATDE